MEPTTSPKTQPGPEPKTPTPVTNAMTRRGNFYFGLGFTLFAGLEVVVALGLVGITGFGIFTVSTAFAMAGIAIVLIAAASLVTLFTLRRTLALLSHHDSILSEQAIHHADLADKAEAQWRAKQIIRNHNQDEAMETLSEQATYHADLADKAQAQWHAKQIIRNRNQDEAMEALSARQDSPLQDSGFVNLRPKRNHVRKAGTDIFAGGQIHPVIDVEGIGAHHSKLLVDLGVKDTKQLWNADTTYLAGALEVTPAAVDEWQCMAELMAITDIGKQYAELLVRSGVPSIPDLRNETAKPLLARIKKLENRLEDRVQDNTIGIKMVQSWIGAAQAHRCREPTVATKV